MATSTNLLLPTTIAFDSSGNLYIAETNHHVIDRIDPGGVLTIYAGNGVQGFSVDAGPANTAQLDSPQGLALDSSNNLYIADTHNHRIRKVSAATGMITTVAGVGTPGFSGDAADATRARLNLPTALAVDPSGNLYIADSNNHRVREVGATSGMIHTVAGNGVQADAGDNGPALAASIDTPTGLAIDSTGNLYLADTHNHRIRRVAAASGIITTVAGGILPPGASASAARLLLPHGLSLDSSGNLYVADAQAHRILRITPDGTLTTVAGEGIQGLAGDNGPAIAALLDSPRSAAISPAGLLTLADTGNQRVRQLDTSAVINTLSGTSTPTPLTLATPATTEYGTAAHLAATIASPVPATGSITFLDTSTSPATSLGSSTLTASTASFSTSSLAAGTHAILAIYPGDPTHPAQQSHVALLNIIPATISVLPNSVTIIYGQPIPPLTGSITGVFPQDASLVSATFSTTATLLSPAATYPIATVLTGPSAANYQITTLTPASLNITQASTATALAATATNPATLSTRTLSTTRGSPTGRITYFDTGGVVGSSAIDASGSAVFTATFAPGPHSVTAVYSGDANFLSSTSAAVVPVVSTAPATQDFTLATTNAPSQTTAAGSSAAYAFTVSVLNGPLDSPIVLTASGMPPSATASFSPTLIPPGTTSSAFTFTVQTAKNSAHGTSPRTLLLAILLLPTLFNVRPRRMHRTILSTAVATFLLASLVACGNVVSSIPKASSAMAVYPIIVTATTTSSSGGTLQHTAAVTLTLQ